MDFSDDMVDEIFKIFQVESEEIISRLNNNILDLEKNPNNQEAILLLFRDAHSLKGAARMVGLNNVQTLAHKMEDVLGLAKENTIALNSKVVDILYKTVDILSELIEKAIEKGQDVYSENATKQVEILDNIEEYVDKNAVKTETKEFDAEKFKESIDKINLLVPECLFTLMKIQAGPCDSQIQNLLYSVKDLYDIFNSIGQYDIKKSIEDVKVKLEFTMRGSNCLNNSEVEELQQVFNGIISNLEAIATQCKIEILDYYSIAFEKMSAQAQTELKSEKTIAASAEEPSAIFPHEKETETNAEKIVSEVVPQKIPEISHVEKKYAVDLSFIKEKISKIIKNVGSLSEIHDYLVSFSSDCKNDDAKSILLKIIEVFDFAKNNEIQFNEDTVEVLVQSIDFCDNAIQNKTGDADKALIFQRLEIIQQVLNLSTVKSDSGVFVNPKEEKIKKVTDFSDVFNSSEIKTLRVDSVKLDSLVNQTNELAVSKIKTKKHLHELSTISKEMEEWQKNLTKVVNYLKYYDKKFIQPGSGDNTVFAKQILGLFSDNNKKIQKLSFDISGLYRTIQEDGMKMNVVIDNLNTMVKNIRVLPLATVFHLFGRMVRDIAQEKNKKIDFEIVGSETTTDKKIIEEIKTPLIHIIRNAIDHGIEIPEEREKLGKNPVGKIILSAKQVNNKVIIEIVDDGRGIDIEKLREKALNKGFLTKEEIDSMSDEQITNIIFAPGFSTDDKVTSISGRGIGLDVVQSKISQLNGKVSVISEFNKGCCVRIELPTTMSLMDSFLVEVSGQTFAIPIESINTVLRKSESDMICSNNRKTILFKGETVPVYDLSTILKLPKSENEKEKVTIIILESSNKMIAVSVDKLLGEQEILHKKLSAPFYKLKNVSGITTLVSGEICLILNVVDIIKATSNIKNCSNLIASNKSSNSSFNVLVVDDSVTTRTLEKNILSKLGYIVDTAENPLIALEKMRNDKFDLIISDVEMPEMNGIEFLRKLKSDERYSSIPVMILSSVIKPDVLEEAKSLGAAKYISKGEFDQDVLQKFVSTILVKD